MRLNKTFTLICGAAIFAISFSKSGENLNVDISALEELNHVQEQTFEYTPKSEYSKLVTDNVINAAIQINHADMAANNGISNTEVKLVYFTPPGWENKFAYAQINFYRGDVRGTSYVLFYPDAESGALSDAGYAVAAQEEYPCNICQIESIEVTKDEMVVGHFFDLADKTKKFTKTMDYNFGEMYIHWD